MGELAAVDRLQSRGLATLVMVTNLLSPGAHAQGLQQWHNVKRRQGKWVFQTLRLIEATVIRGLHFAGYIMETILSFALMIKLLMGIAMPHIHASAKK